MHARNETETSLRMDAPECDTRMSPAGQIYSTFPGDRRRNAVSVPQSFCDISRPARSSKDGTQ